MKTTVVRQLAASRDAWNNCRLSDVPSIWEERHKGHIAWLCKNKLPSGSGFDAGTRAHDIHKWNRQRMIFTTSFHHMDEVGGYDGWTEHEVWVYASLLFDFVLRITGPNHYDIKDYIHDIFYTSLIHEFEQGEMRIETF